MYGRFHIDMREHCKYKDIISYYFDMRSEKTVLS